MDFAPDNDRSVSRFTLDNVLEEAASLRALLDLQEELQHAGLDVDAIVSRLAQLAERLTAADGAVVEIAEGDDMVYQSACGSLSGFNGFRVRAQGSLSGLCVERGETLVSTDTLSDPRVDAVACRRVRARSMVVVPLCRGDETVGVLKVAATTPDAFGERDRALLELMAGQMGMALAQAGDLAAERARRAASERRAAEHAGALASLEERQLLLMRLARVQGSIARNGAADELLASIVAGAYELIGEEIVALRTVEPVDPSWTEIVASRGISETDLERVRRQPVGEGPGGRAIAEDRLIALDGLTSASDLAGVPATAAMAAPLHEGERVTGSLVVASTRPGRIFTAHEHDVLIAFAEHASLALADALMLDGIHDALRDPVTGLPNRRLFSDRLDAAAAATPDGQVEPAVLVIDFDSFGLVSEGLGHELGDQLVHAVADRIAMCVDGESLVARIDGDDFGVLLGSQADRAAPERVAERLLDALRTPFEVGEREIAVNASIGIASGVGPARETLRCAETAMHRARRRGRGGYERYAPERGAGLLQHLELEADLRRAVERGEFEVHYQPIIALQRRELVAFEALVRWRHPKRGLIPPLAFIPLSEDTGLINEIGRVVLAAACRDAVRWEAEAEGAVAPFVTVNLSARQLERDDIVAEVGGALRDSGIAARRLVLEMTETLLMRDPERAQSTLLHLKNLGTRLAIDDFGTGYSSLHYIQRFPLDMLKIAKPFIDGVGRAREDAALVRTILELAATFELEVVAEGIETARQHTELTRLGCDLGQGFHFARPLPSDEAQLLVQRAGSGFGHLGGRASEDFSLPKRPPRRTQTSSR
jgi:diguanylate cyclase (GGDEF)-like protein